MVGVRMTDEDQKKNACIHVRQITKASAEIERRARNFRSFDELFTALLQESRDARFTNKIKITA
jgi:hypothetical protein